MSENPKPTQDTWDKVNNYMKQKESEGYKVNFLILEKKKEEKDCMPCAFMKNEDPPKASARKYRAWKPNEVMVCICKRCFKEIKQQGMGDIILDN